jgi:plasmid replication initiation protein
MTDLVTKSNKLIQALQTLTLTESRLLQLVIVDARETGHGLSSDKPLELNAMRYAEAFGVESCTAYDALIAAEDTLFKRQFTVTNNDGSVTKSRWIQDANYQKGEGRILITLTRVVIEHVTQIDGFEQHFTQYRLKQTAQLTSAYAIRLYELLIQWRKTSKTPVLELEKFRQQLGVGVNEYQKMNDFKRRVLDLAVGQINEHTDITASYEQIKSGRTITGFVFKFKEKKSAIEHIELKSVKRKMPKNPFKDVDDMAAFLKKHQQGVESMDETHKRLLRESESGKFSMSHTD